MSFEPKPFGKYFLTEKIAVGGMAEIYKAKTFGVDGFEKLLAIKKILPHYSADKEFIAMLTDEAKLVVLLSHTNVVQIYDLGKVGDDYYISMEYIDGVNLREVVNRGLELKGKIPLPICLYITSEICKGLDYAHNKRDGQGVPLHIVHRDVSPQNILISFESEVKIVDFGIAKAALNVSHTTSGILKGKVTYMSPEQALGKPVDHRTDIFSAGILLYEMITGDRLFTGETQLEVLKKIRSTRITDKTLKSDIPPEARTILAKALAYYPKDRFQSAGDFQIELTKLLYTGFSDYSPKQLSTLIKNWFGPELKLKKKLLQDESSIDSETRSILEEAVEQKSIVHKEVSKSGKNKFSSFFADTAKPADNLSPGDLNHGPGRKPTRGRYLPLVMGIAALALAGLVATAVFYWKNRPPPIMPPVEQGQVEIISRPDGAHIFLDEKNTGATTPSTLRDLPLKTDLQLRLEMAGFEHWEKKLFLGTGDLVTVEVDLQAVPSANLTIKSDPDDATITFNNVDIGETTPLTIENIDVGKTYELRLTKENYHPWEKQITIENAGPVTVLATLEKIKTPLASLLVESQPGGARIFLDGVDTGQVTPTRFENLAFPQVYKIELVRENYVRQTKEIKLAEDKAYTENLTLEPVKVAVITSLEITASVGHALISIDGVKKGEAPQLLKLEPGKYRIAVAKKGFRTEIRTVQIVAGIDKKFHFDLREETTPVVNNTNQMPQHTINTGMGQLRVDSMPRGASVVLDGNRAGITPIVIPRVDRTKSHTLVVTLPGYKPWSQTITLDKSELELTAPLQKQ